MPLYKVEFEGEIVINSEAGPPDDMEVRDALREEVSGMGGGIDALCVWDPVLVTPKVHIGEWEKSRPYNREDDKSCAEILEAEAEDEKRRPPSLDEIEAAGQQRLIA